MNKESIRDSKPLLKKLSSLFRRMGDRIVIGNKSSQKVYLINPASLMYIEADQNYTNWYFSDGTNLFLSCQLGVCEELITSQIDCDVFTLARVGRSFIINFQYISLIDTTNKTLVLSSHNNVSKELSVSEDHLKLIKEAIIQYKEANENR